MTDLLSDLEYRGFIHQTTDRDELAKHLSEPRSVYAGFDPTSDSLTIGNLVPICLLRLFQRAGHRPVVVMGGGTGLIGDPSGKDSERVLQTAEQVAENVRGQSRIFERILDFSGPGAAKIANNADWLSRLSYLEVLRDIGKHFSVNMMIQKDSIREWLREREQGISYTEFSYMLLQAYDFLHLFDHEKVTVQAAGSDQWGNIVAGIDLIRRLRRQESYALTSPLLLKSDGTKFGKSEKGAVWLTKERTSAYAFYQFWLNAADADVERYLKLFTLLGREQIEEMLAEHRSAPEKRTAQKFLASETTRLLHGEDALAHAISASEALFSGAVDQLPKDLLEEVFAEAPSTERPASELSAPGVDLITLLVETGQLKSRREAKEMLASGAINVNGARASAEDRVVREGLLHGSIALVRKGKKSWHLIRWK